MDCNKAKGYWQDALINQNDFILKIVHECLQKVIECEFNKFIGAKEYERTEARNGLRNGHYERQLKTRIGSVNLRVCRDRAGEFKTELFDRYQRSEKALVFTIIDMYFEGVATRKVSGIMEELCGFSVSKSQVSELVKTVDEKLDEWRNRQLTKKYPYLIFDARYEKVRENGHVISKAFVTTIGISEDGMREVLGCWVINSESYEAWDYCLQNLKGRGLHGVMYVVTDENKGLRMALQKHFQETKLQRCQVHFMRNFMGKLAKSEQAEGIKLLQNVFASETKEAAIKSVQHVKEFLLAKKKDRIACWLEENIEDTLVVFELPVDHRTKMKSTNMIERLNQELKRRSRVVRIFPNEASCLRLLSAICQETSENWQDKKYLDFNLIFRTPPCNRL